MVLPATGTDFNAVANAGISDNLVQTAYDLYIREEFNSQPVFRQFVTVRPVNQPHPGEAVVLQRYNWFSQSTINGWKTPLTETSDVSATKLPATTPVTLTPNVYGAVTATTEYLDYRTLAPFDAYKAKAMADGAVKTVDEVIQDKIKAGISETTVDGGAENALTSADVLTASVLRSQFTKFSEQDVPTWDGQFYVAVVHPRVLRDLRAEAGAGGWRYPKEYTNDRLLATAGEAGEFEGFRFIVNNRVRKGTGSATGYSGGPAASYNSYFFGREGLAEAEWMPLQSVVGPVVDNLRRFATLGWKIDADWGVFNPKAIDISLSSSSNG